MTIEPEGEIICVKQWNCVRCKIFVTLTIIMKIVIL